jgi:hypothetical protein
MTALAFIAGVAVQPLARRLETPGACCERGGGTGVEIARLSPAVATVIAAHIMCCASSVVITVRARECKRTAQGPLRIAGNWP